MGKTQAFLGDLQHNISSKNSGRMVVCLLIMPLGMPYKHIEENDLDPFVGQLSINTILFQAIDGVWSVTQYMPPGLA